MVPVMEMAMEIATPTPTTSSNNKATAMPYQAMATPCDTKIK